MVCLLEYAATHRNPIRQKLFSTTALAHSGDLTQSERDLWYAQLVAMQLAHPGHSIRTTRTRNTTTAGSVAATLRDYAGPWRYERGEPDTRTTVVLMSTRSNSAIDEGIAEFINDPDFQEAELFQQPVGITCLIKDTQNQRTAADKTVIISSRKYRGLHIVLGRNLKITATPAILNIIPLLEPELFGDDNITAYHRLMSIGTESAAREAWALVEEDINKILADYNAEQRAQNILNVERHVQNTLHRRMQNHIVHLLEEVDAYKERYCQAWQKLTTARHDYELNSATSSSDFKDFLLRLSPKVLLDTRMGPDNALEVTLHTAVNNYDADYLNRTLRNNRYDGHRWWLHKVFIEEKYTMYFTTQLKIDVINRGQTPAYAGPGIDERIGCANPHIRYYRCWGGYAVELAHASNKGDLIDSINLSIAALGNLNFTDSTVMETFLHDVPIMRSHYAEPPNDWSRRKTIFKDNETGEMVSYFEMYQAYRKEQEDEVNQSETT